MYTYDFAGTRESAHCKREAIGLIRLETVGDRRCFSLFHGGKVLL